MANSSETSYKSTKQGILPHSKIAMMEARATKLGLQKLAKIAESKQLLTVELILSIHKYCFYDILDDDAGIIRNIQVTYSGKEAPLYSRVRELIKVLFDDTEYAISQLPKRQSDEYIGRFIELLAHFQHRFVYIHPFVDYNGRMSRLFTNYLLMREGLPIIEVNVNRKQARTEYIQSLQSADNGDYALLEKILTQSISESFEKII